MTVNARHDVMIVLLRPRSEVLTYEAVVDLPRSAPMVAGAELLLSQRLDGVDRGRSTTGHDSRQECREENH